MNVRLSLGLLVASLAGAVIAARPVASQPEFVVVVNNRNPVNALSAAEVSKIFLKQAQLWPDGNPTAPVDLAEGSTVRAAFSQRVLHRPVAAVKSFWQQQVFSGVESPPPEAATDAEVLSIVRSLPGGIGYVSGNAPLTGVHVVSLR